MLILQSTIFYTSVWLLVEMSPAVRMITIDNCCWYDRCDNGKRSALSGSCGICCMNAQGMTVF